MNTLYPIVAKVFVTTFYVGNTKGFATGKWFDLGEFGSKDGFMETAIEYAKNELGDPNPEICFSDREIGFKASPRDTDNELQELNELVVANLISETEIADELWEMNELDYDDLNILNAYVSGFGMSDMSVLETFDNAKNEYAGKYASRQDFAYEQADMRGDLADMPEYIKNAIDWDKVADAIMEGFAESEGHYFFN